MRALHDMWELVVVKEKVPWPAAAVRSALPTLQQVQHCLCTLLSPEHTSNSSCSSGDGRRKAALLAVRLQLHIVESQQLMQVMCLIPELAQQLGPRVRTSIRSQLLATAALQQVTAVCQLLRRHHMLPHKAVGSSSNSGSGSSGSGSRGSGSSSSRAQHTLSEHRAGAGAAAGAAAAQAMMQQLPGGKAYIDAVAAVTKVSCPEFDGVPASVHLSKWCPAQCCRLRTGHSAVCLLTEMVLATHPRHWTNAAAEQQQQQQQSSSAEACVPLSPMAAELALELQLLAPAQLQQLHQWSEQLSKTQQQQQQQQEQQLDAEQQQPMPQEHQLQREQCDLALQRLGELEVSSRAWLHTQLQAVSQSRGGSLQQALQQSGVVLLQALTARLAANAPALTAHLLHGEVELAGDQLLALKAAYGARVTLDSLLGGYYANAVH
jgi:hypothetical protein